MKEKVVLCELHDAELSSIVLRASELTLALEELSSFFATSEAELYDVRSCSGTLTVRGLTSIRIQTPLEPGTRVSRGRVLVNGADIDLNALGSRTGHCHVELQMSDGTEAMVEGTGIEFNLAHIGDAFEQWSGPLSPRSDG